MEREREREDFQQEIQRLEEQLRQAARPRSPGLRDSHVSQPCRPCLGELFSMTVVSFVINDVFAFHVRGNNSGPSWIRRYRRPELVCVCPSFRTLGAAAA